MTQLFDVYPLYDIEPVKASGSYLWDKAGNQYLDFYGGHAVISIGHSHPAYVRKLSEQLTSIGFYSNSVIIPQQKELAEKLGELSGLTDYALFLTNSGAEANENALKLASFHTNRKKVVAFTKSFHGRTSGSVAITDNPSIISPFNAVHDVSILPFNDVSALEEGIDEQVAAVIVEGIQGVGGIRIASPEFLTALRKKCDETGAVLILDCVQSGYGRTGKFFAFQHTDILPDLVTMAKGMGNGFPIGGVLISPIFKATHGLLGTTFGGNHLACAAGIAVLNVMKDEALIENAARMGEYLFQEIKQIGGYKDLRGQGLMIGIEYDFPVAPIRKELLSKHRIFTGISGSNVIRLLPSLAVTQSEADQLLDKLKVSLMTVA